MSPAQFWVDPGTLPTPNDSIILLPEAAHKHALVKRIRVQETVRLADGRGQWALGTYVDIGSGSVRVFDSGFTAAPRHPIVLIQALAKGDRALQAIEAATEYGVSGVVPWQAQRSIVQWRGARARKSAQKWAHLLRAAAGQSRRSRIPELYDLQAGAQAASMLAGMAAAFICEPEAPVHLLEELTGSSNSAVPIPPGPIAIIIGPEGGITPEESAAFRQAGAKSVSLGDAVMRASSAGPAAVILAVNTLQTEKHPAVKAVTAAPPLH